MKILKNAVEQVACAVAVDRRDRDRLAQTEVVELIKLHRRLSDGIALVDTEHHRLAGLLQHLRHVCVGGDHAAFEVGDKNNGGCGVNGELCLPAHLREDHVVALGLDAAGVHHHRRVAAPLGLAVNTVARDARRIVHDGQPLSDQFIKQGALADIRSADNRNNGLCHVKHLHSSL